MDPATKGPAVSRARAWWLASRPKTLSAAVAPVAVGTALAYHDGAFHLAAAVAALVGALLIQIGTNFANDLLDFRRGADSETRLGPTRVVQAGLLDERAVAWGTVVAFGLASGVGLYLIARAGWPILVLGVVSIASGVLYTAGPYPLAYVGLGDLFVLAFFGLAAVGGTYYVQALALTPSALWLGLAVGALSTAILTVNNLRDIATDAAVGKRTLPVRLGDRWTRRYYVALLLLAFLIPVALVLLGRLDPPVLLVLLGLLLAGPPVRGVRRGMSGKALNEVLGMTARLQIVHALLLALGLVL